MRKELNPLTWSRPDKIFLGISALLAALLLCYFNYLLSDSESIGAYLSHPVSSKALAWFAGGAFVGVMVGYFQGGAIIDTDDGSDYRP